MTESAMTAMETRLSADMAGLKHDIQLVDAKVDRIVDRVDRRMDQGFRQIVDCLDRRL